MEMGKGEFVEIFREEAEERVKRSLELLDSLSKDPDVLGDLMREAHTLKGSARMVGLQRTSDLAHRIEDILTLVKNGELKFDETVKRKIADAFNILLRMIDSEEGEDVDKTFETLNQLLGKTGEEKNVDKQAAGKATKEKEKIVRSEKKAEEACIVKEKKTREKKETVKPTEAEKKPASKPAGLKLRRKTGGFIRVSPEKIENAANLAEDAFMKMRSIQAATLPREVTVEISNIEKDLKELQSELSEMRLLPISDLYSSFTEAIDELARKFGKQVELVLEGADVRLDRRIIDHLREPMIHILRNAIDHGIEKPDERMRLGKDSKGKIAIRAYDDGKRIRIEIEDDGRGIDIEKIREKAVERGILPEKEAKSMNEKELLELIFLQGFSTKDVATELSGRGFGLDIVKAKLEEIGGRVEVETWPGMGTRFVLYVPLTLATQRIVLFSVGDGLYAVPSTSLSRIFAYNQERIHDIEGQAYFDIGEKRVPLFDIRMLLAVTPKARGRVLLTRNNDAAFVVDEVLTETETVVRKFLGYLGQMKGLIGYTFYSGKVVILLNLEKLKEASAGRSQSLRVDVKPSGEPEKPKKEKVPEKKEAKKRILVVEDSAISRELLKGIMIEEGYEVLTAEDGVEALRILRSEPVDLVITDIQMPNMDGITLTREIRGDPKLKDLPIVIVTSKGKEEEMKKGLDAGADAYLIKGRFTPQELKEKVKWLLE